MALSLDLQLKNLASGETSHVALPSGLFAFFSGWLSNRGIQLRSGRPRVSISPAFESLDDPPRRDLQLPLQPWQPVNRVHRLTNYLWLSSLSFKRVERITSVS